MHPSPPSRSPRRVSLGPLVVGVLASAGAGCLKKSGVEQHFYDNHIQPIFNNSCINGTSPCHRVDPATGVALGNLDLTSFENVQKRRDALRTYGSYTQPLLLLKVLPETQVTFPFRGVSLPSEIRHTGGKPISSSKSTNHAAITAASLDGLSTTVFPETIAAAVMPIMMAPAKFQGGITAPTPRGMYTSSFCSPASGTTGCGCA